MATVASDTGLARALETRLRPLLPWWFRFYVKLDDERGELSHRVVRFGLRSRWGKQTWNRGMNPGHPDHLSLTDEVEEVLFAIQSAVWNAKHRQWPARNGKLGALCAYDSLPEPEVVIREFTVYASFPGVGVTFPPIDLSRSRGR
jgi:hypothetical protein